MRAAALHATSPTAEETSLEQQLEAAFRASRLRATWVAQDIVHDAEEAADLVQEAFLRVQQALPRFRGESALHTYALRVVVNLALKSERRRRVRTRLRHLLTPWARVDEGEAHRSPTPEELASGAEQGLALRAALGQLPAMQRAAFVLRHAHDLPLAEVAAVLQISEGTVKTHLTRAVKRLRSVLLEENRP